MLSRSLTKAVGVLSLCLAVCVTASAQYGGGGSGGSGGTGTGTGGSGNTSGYGSNSGKAIGIGVGVAAGAAVGIALLVHHRHASARSEASVIGCTQSVLNGISLMNEKDNQTYMLISNGTPLQPGERVELKGAVANESSDVHAFHVRSLVKNYGTCSSTSAATGKSPDEKNEMVQSPK